MKRGPTVPPAGRRGPVGSQRSPRRPVGLPWGPWGVRILVMHRIGVPSGCRQNPVLARQAPTSFHRSLDCPVLVHDLDTDSPVVLRWPHGLPKAPSRPDGTPAAGRGHRRTPFHRSPPVWGSYEALTPICLSRDLCTDCGSLLVRSVCIMTLA